MSLDDSEKTARSAKRSIDPLEARKNMPPLTAEDHAIADEAAAMSLANLKRNALAGNNPN